MIQDLVWYGRDNAAIKKLISDKSILKGYLYGWDDKYVDMMYNIMNFSKNFERVDKLGTGIDKDLDDAGISDREDVDEGKDHPAYELSKHPTKPAPKMPDQSKVKPAPEFKEDDETKARTQKYYDEHPNALD